MSDALENRRRMRRRGNNAGQDADQDPQPAPRREPSASAAAYDNRAFDADDRGADEEPPAPPEIEELDAQGNRPSGSRSAITARHRDRSRDLASKVQEEEPSEVIQDLHIVRDKIRDKIKDRLVDQILKVRAEGPTDADAVQDADAAELDSSARRGGLQSRLSATDSSMKASTTLSRIKRIQSMDVVASSSLAEFQERQESERTYRLVGDGSRTQTRFDNDNDDAEPERPDDEDTLKLNRLSEARAKRGLRFIAQSVVQEIHMPNREEQYDFFSKAWERFDDDELPLKSKARVRKEQDAAAGGGGAVDEITPESGGADKLDDKSAGVAATEQTALLMRDDDWQDLSYCRAQYVPHEQQKRTSSKLLYIPSSANISLKRKLGEHVETPRVLEAEGYYVGRKPYMTKRNKNLMEHRILRANGDAPCPRWFGPDGEIAMLADPIKYVATRPSFYNTSLSVGLETRFRKALYVSDFADNLVAERGATDALNLPRYRIDLDVSQVQFNYHHLFSSEHVLAFKLRSMYQHYKLSQEQNMVEILTAKLKALREALAKFRVEVASNVNRNAASRNMYVESTSTVLRSDSNPSGGGELVSKTDFNRLTAYQNEIKLTRQQREMEMRQRKQLAEKILQTWKELKNVRNMQQFRNTDLKLFIKKKEANRELEQRTIDQDLNDEFEELRGERAEELQREQAVYKQRMNAYKFQQTRKAEARRRQEARARQKEAAETAPATFNIRQAALNREEEEKDARILAEEDLPVPTAPAELDEAQILAQIKERYAQSRKPPGDPHLFFELVEEAGAVSSSGQCSAVEQTRRAQLNRTRVYVRIFVNDKLVHTTKEAPLQDDFSAVWAQIFNIYTIGPPDSIALQVFEHAGARSRERLVAQVNVPAPERNATARNYSLEAYDFSSPHVFYMHLKSSNQIELLFTSGVLRCGSGWGFDESSGELLVPPVAAKTETALKQEEMKNYDAIAALGVSRLQDMEKLYKWIVKSNLDPNDPRNADLINLIRAITDVDGGGFDASAGFKLPEYFRLDQMSQEFDFVRDEDIEANKRFRLIVLRAQEVPEFRGLKMIPALERYVRKDAFDEYERRLQRSDEVDDDLEPAAGATTGTMGATQLLQSTTTGLKESARRRLSGTAGASTLRLTSPRGTREIKNEIEIAREEGQIYMRKIRERILSQFRVVQNQKQLSDIVIEEQVPEINFLGHLFWSLYVEPRRPLYPSRRERKKITGQNILPEDVHLLVNIINAYDLPVRKERLENDFTRTMKDTVTGRSLRANDVAAELTLVRPFVEVSFQETVHRTSTADGPNASWNQEMHLPFKAPNNDFRPDSLQTCKDNLYINVYDEIEVDAIVDDRDRDNTVHKKLHRYWLGSLKIPFSTIYFQSRIEGTFKLESPPIMLGYTRDPQANKPRAVGFGEVLRLEAPVKDSSYLTVFVTIEPQLLVPDQFRESYDSFEDIDFLEKVVAWTEKFTKKHPTREVRATVMDTEGRSVFITRFLRPIRPPEELIENGETSAQTVQNIARFVWMIPFVADSLIFPGISDIWSRCDQFLQILAGDQEEHAVLMVNFLLGLGKPAWLLIGKSNTDGACVYPLTLETFDTGPCYIIWYQGQPYKVNEPHNPVKVVSALVNAENIWLNTQSFDEPYRIRFDVTESRAWMPFFTRSNPNKLATVQPERLNYFKTDPKFVRELETRIENRLREKLQEWRPRHLTKFNRYGSAALRQILSTMERTQNRIEPEEIDELKQLQNSYRISGFPLNMPYTNMKSIVEAVFATQVHRIPTSDIEYALGVHIHAYPNTILSVWVYIAVLSRRS